MLPCSALFDTQSCFCMLGRAHRKLGAQAHKERGPSFMALSFCPSETACKLAHPKPAIGFSLVSTNCSTCSCMKCPKEREGEREARRKKKKNNESSMLPRIVAAGPTPRGLSKTSTRLASWRVCTVPWRGNVWCNPSKRVATSKRGCEKSTTFDSL